MVDSKIDLSGYAKRTASGSVDIQATHLQFTKDIAELVAAEKTDNEVIALAVEKAFRDRQLTTLGMPAILHYAMENLEVDPTNFNMVRERVANFVRTNQRNYKVSKGKGGGVQWLGNEQPASLPPSSNSVRPRQHA